MKYAPVRRSSWALAAFLILPVLVFLLAVLPGQAHAAERTDFVLQDIAADPAHPTAADLQTAIDQAGTTPSRIILTAQECTIDKTIKIPAGADIQLVGVTDTDQSSVLARARGFKGSLLKVEKTAALTLGEPGGGTVTIDSRGKVTPSTYDATIDVLGSLTMEDAVVRGTEGMSENFLGAITVHGAGALFTMNGGTVTQNRRLQEPQRAQYGGANVSVTDQAHFIMNGGTISRGAGSGSGRDNSEYGEAGGVGVYRGAHFTMNGGEIIDNAGFGGGVVAFQWTYGSDIKRYVENGTAEAKMSADRVTVEINGGRIANNRSSFGGGGILIFGNAAVTMTGGEITGNSAPNGGGVCAMNLFTWGSGYSYSIEIPGEGKDSGLSHEDYARLVPGSFTMRGGKIAHNEASRTGGGVNVVSSGVTLSGGEISDNTARQQGGGVYVATKSYTTHILDAAIYENAASYVGGGIWTCPTGSIKLYVTHGAALFENKAEQFGDDLAHDSYGGFGGQPLFLADRVLGGAPVKYYWDNNDARFDPEKPGEPVRFKGGDQDILLDKGLHAVVESPAQALNGTKFVRPDGTELALGGTDFIKEFSALKIFNNKAPRGGGIGTNGHVVFGEPKTFDLEIDKSWVNNVTNNEISANDVRQQVVKLAVKVSVTREGADGAQKSSAYIIQGMDLVKPEQAGTDWKLVATGLPLEAPGEAGTLKLNYTVVEIDPLSNEVLRELTEVVPTDAGTSAKGVPIKRAELTNQIVNLRVDKLWLTENDKQVSSEKISRDSVRVAICRTDSAGASETLGEITVGKDTNWSKPVEIKRSVKQGDMVVDHIVELPALDAHGKPYTYWAIELGVEGAPVEPLDANAVSKEARIPFDVKKDEGIRVARVVNRVNTPPSPPEPPTPPKPPAPPTPPKPPAPPTPPSPPRTPKTPPTGSLPRTGDDTAIWTGGLILAGGVALVVALILRRRRQ
ncbi:LPXTG cell wall anchor domain-containing protein [Collinsella sp. AGMB00827]|uniref:LPXTG cell wall anchor domain-containing protein n=1 Tax=Collinsella ureilytica TaxID=2869515 RepID=A0ABS7MM02_9ACTN|nr:LPXTG cell wall anchor domain-containing protein [Collinsella urealyticum]MBY4798393.1 LPXTG cell wall anchor domain-containing protein [Collinsella urealyticum]